MEYHKGLIWMLLIANVIICFSLIFISSPTGMCILGTQCGDVQNSSYGTIFGIKLGILGFIAFLALLAIYLMVERNKIPRKYFLWSTTMGALFAIYFIYLQLFVLKQLCSTCMIIDSLMILITGISFYDYKLKNKKG